MVTAVPVTDHTQYYSEEEGKEEEEEWDAPLKEVKLNGRNTAQGEVVCLQVLCFRKPNERDLASILQGE